jgi:hypothetical protein
MEVHTTIGAAAFHFRVRDGIGWDHSAIAARERVGAAQALRRLHNSEESRHKGRVLLFRETDLAFDKGVNE